MSKSINVINYKAGAYISVEGERGDNLFFIIQKGQVILTKARATKEFAKQILSPGDFFEVESALTNRTRIFTSIAKTECSLLIIHRGGFGSIIQKKPSLVQKIILQFSQKMRSLDNVLAQLSQEDHATKMSSDILAEIGDYYEETGFDQSAVMAYYHYIKQNPNGTLVSHVQSKLDFLIKTNGESIKEGVEVDPKATVMNVSAGKMIFCKGMVGRYMYFIQSGSVKICTVTKDTELTFAVLEKGELFGEMALLEDKPRSANAMAVSDCRLLVISYENFPIMVQRQPNLITRITTVLSERLWFIYRQIAVMVMPEGEARLYDALMMFIEREKIDESANKSVTLDMSVKDLIKYIAMDEAKTQKIIKEFVRDKVIQVTEKEIIINSVQYINNRVGHFKSINEEQKRKNK